ncbi:hypothetical protein Taro_014883, partial [Colocasia esculenta]|nr:hypothetical protein [Colocasia esculenta]
EVAAVVIAAVAVLCCRAAAVSIASPPPCAAAPLLSPSRRRRSQEAVRGQCVKGRLSRLRFVKELYHTQGKMASSRSIASILLLVPKNVVSGTRNNKMTGKKVKLLDLENEQVAEGIVMSMDPAKIVMGRPIGTVYCEVSIHYANKPDAPLFVKDDHRFRIKDAIGSHILWFRDYVLVDEAKQTLFSGTIVFSSSDLWLRHCCSACRHGEDVYREGAVINMGDAVCRQKAIELLQAFNDVPSGLLPFEDVEEVGYNPNSGFVWLRQKKARNHFFRKIGHLVSYAFEVTAVTPAGLSRSFPTSAFELEGDGQKNKEAPAALEVLTTAATDIYQVKEPDAARKSKKSKTKDERRRRRRRRRGSPPELQNP